MKHLLILAVFMTAFFMSSSVQAKIYYGVIVASCMSVDAIKEIAKADEFVGPEETKVVFRKLKIARLCGNHIPPVLVRLEKRIYKYTDTLGRQTEIWKILGTNFYALIGSEKLLQMPTRKELFI